LRTLRAEGHPQFVQYLQEVLGGIKDWQTQAKEHVGVNLQTLNRDQQQLYQALLQLNTDAQAAGTIAEETAAQYWEELQSRRQHMKG
jgi:outer membrane murein-binding lipoprotein Lpp